MSKTFRLYHVVISRMDDEDGITGIDLDVDEDTVLLLMDMSLGKGHRFTVNGFDEVEEP